MDSAIAVLANVIELAVAPVFLLAGIAGFLNVMSGRLGRIVDRARVMERRVVTLDNEERREAARYELKTLWRRANLINWSIGLCTTSAALVCTVVVGLFIGDFWQVAIGTIVVGLFVIALISLIIALLMFLKEVQLANRILQMGRELNTHPDS